MSSSSSLDITGGPAIVCGYMIKKGNRAELQSGHIISALGMSSSAATWSRCNRRCRFFVLFESQLKYYTDESQTRLRGTVSIHVASIRPSEDPTAPPRCIDIVTAERTYTVQPQGGQASYEKWAFALSRAARPSSVAKEFQRFLKPSAKLPGSTMTLMRSFGRRQSLGERKAPPKKVIQQYEKLMMQQVQDIIQGKDGIDLRRSTACFAGDDLVPDVSTLAGGGDVGGVGVGGDDGDGGGSASGGKAGPGLMLQPMAEGDDEQGVDGNGDFDDDDDDDDDDDAGGEGDDGITDVIGGGSGGGGGASGMGSPRRARTVSANGDPHAPQDALDERFGVGSGKHVQGADADMDAAGGEDEGGGEDGDGGSASRREQRSTTITFNLGWMVENLCQEYIAAARSSQIVPGNRRSNIEATLLPLLNDLMVDLSPPSPCHDHAQLIQELLDEYVSQTAPRGFMSRREEVSRFLKPFLMRKLQAVPFVVSAIQALVLDDYRSRLPSPVVSPLSATDSASTAARTVSDVDLVECEASGDAGEEQGEESKATHRRGDGSSRVSSATSSLQFEYEAASPQAASRPSSKRSEASSSSSSSSQSSQSSQSFTVAVAGAAGAAGMSGGAFGAADAADAAPPAIVPSLRICIMTVGSRGDVQPFVGLGLGLQAQGHRVRLATHEVFRSFVEGHGLEFAPLAGDPKELMAMMVRNNNMFSVGFIKDGLTTKRSWIRKLLASCWEACTSPDKSYQADAIIANPPSFAHVHIAEALNIPLHMVFTMPWTPTRAFQSPFFTSAAPADTARNAFSYHAVDRLIWMGTRDLVNEFRHRIGLRRIGVADRQGHRLLARRRVPFTYCFSKHLLPKPADWNVWVDVSGFFFLDNPDLNYEAPADLLAFLKRDPDRPPVFVGFGSIVVKDPDALTQLVIEAIVKSGRRAIIQKGWAGMEPEGVPDDIYMIGRAPHDWLFQQCSLVVHHGGAGTTAAGLRAGKPTVIVPFFGDQFFWGRTVSSMGVGATRPFSSLTSTLLAGMINESLEPEVFQAAQRLGADVRRKPNRKRWEEWGEERAGLAANTHAHTD